MRFKLFLILTITATTMITHNLFAQEMMNCKSNRNNFQVCEKLNLTEAQQEKVDALRFDHQKEMIDLKANLETKEVEIAELKNYGNYTREEFLNKVNEIISARNDIALSLANHQMDVYQILDDSQKKEWNKCSLNFGERKEKRLMRKMKDLEIE